MESFIATTFLIIMNGCTAIQATSEVPILAPINEFYEATIVDIIKTRTAKPLIIIVFDNSQDNFSPQRISIVDTLERLQIQSLLVEFQNVVQIFSSSLLRDYKDDIFIFAFCYKSSCSTLLKIHKTEIMYGNNFILRHFTKWIIFDANQERGPIIQPMHDVVQDHVALITTTERDKRGGLDSLMHHQVETNIRAFTLLWTEKGREWKQIPVNAHSVVQHLFPNTKYGLNRRELLCAVLPWTPFLKIEDVKGTNVYSGASVNIIMGLAQKFNFSCRFFSPDDNQWGAELNNSWTGIIGMLQRGEADLCPVQYARNTDRNQVLEFSILFASEPNYVVYKSSIDSLKNWKVSLVVFKWEVYVTRVACLLYVIGLVWILKKIHCHFNPSSPDIFGFDILLFSVGPPLHQGLSITPSSQSGRILLGSWWIFCVIFTSIYTSQLTAGFATPGYPVSFSNLDQLARGSDYRIGLSSFNFLTTVFQNSNLTTYRILSEKKKKNCSPELMNATMESACHKKNLKEGGYALITSIHEIRDLRSEICHLSVMRETVLASSSGMIFPRHSPLAELFSPSLLTMREFGLIDKWTIEHTPKPRKCSMKTTSPTLLNINMFLTIFFTGCIGISLAGITLIIEKCFQRYSKIFHMV